ncbi:MAG: M1 family aminopeptidase, partial [Gemmatimonadaceae bacterium]
PYLANNAYTDVPVVPNENVPEGYRAVRFIAEKVHHFAWSASPDYRYEGGIYVRQVAHQHFQTWDTVSVHVLMKPGDDTTWGGGRAVERTIFALKWLESIWGPYAYPQITNVHRLDPGGTEFPMMIMDGSASQGLILHEAGHVFTYGILGNNEWRSGWMDEGLTDYQTDWAQKLTPQERIGRPPEPPRLPEGYRVNAVTIPPYETDGLSLWRNEIAGRSQPIGTPAYDFREFGIYNEMIYDRAKLMYSQLRDVLGDSAFLAFTHDYYDRWALKHVDERAMRVSAERAYLHDLDWFFDEWVHHTGLMDYSLESVKITTDGASFETTARVHREGELRHPMPVGVHTASGWTIGRMVAQADNDDVKIITTEKPDLIELDPYHVTWDWDWRNNIQSAYLIIFREPRLTPNWPYLDQTDRSHTMVAVAPTAWYSEPQGPVAGIRAKTNYLSLVDTYDVGFAVASRRPTSASGTHPSLLTFANVWARGENIYLPGASRPLMGVGGDVNYLDGLLEADLYQKWDLSPFVATPGPSISAKAYVTAAVPSSTLLLPEQWDKTNVLELGGSGSYKTIVDEDSAYTILRATAAVGFSSGTAASAGPSRGYARLTGSIGAVRPLGGPRSQIRVRLFGGIADDAPRQRAIFASSQDPFETFNNDLFRPRGALFKQDNVNYLPLGGAGLRGFAVTVPLDNVVAGNGEIVQQLTNIGGSWGRVWVSGSIFGDIGSGSSKLVTLSNSLMSDAGAGLVFRGRLYDRDLHVRLDAPIFVNQAGLAGGRLAGSRTGSIAPRWLLTVGDLW